MQKPSTADEIIALTDEYFEYIQGDYKMVPKVAKDSKTGETTLEKEWMRQPEAALISELILKLGFNSRQEFDDYESNSEFGWAAKRARLRVEAEYERRLHQQAPTGAIFALKSLGWHERGNIAAPQDTTVTKLQIEIIHTGPQLAGNEKDVLL